MEWLAREKVCGRGQDLAALLSSGRRMDLSKAREKGDRTPTDRSAIASDFRESTAGKIVLQKGPIMPAFQAIAVRCHGPLIRQVDDGNILAQ